MIPKPHLFVLLLGLSALTAPLAAQEAPGLSVVAGGGYEQGGPGPSLARSLEAAGFGDYHFEGGGVRADYPQYYNAGLNLVLFLGAHYRFEGPFSIDALVSNGSRGHAQGYDAAGPDRLLLRWSTALLTSTAGVHLGPIRIGAGPTLNVLFWDAELNWSDLGSYMTPVLGGTATATARLRTRSVVVSLNAGVRTFMDASLEPAPGLPLETGYDSWFVGLTVIPVDRP